MFYVAVFGEAFKPNAARLQGVDGLDQACEVATKAVEPPYDEGVACAQGFEVLLSSGRSVCLRMGEAS